MRIIIFIFMLLISLGCRSHRHKFTPESKLLYDLNVTYDSIKDFFGEKMVNHFPSDIQSSGTFTESLSSEYGNLEFLYFDIDSNTITNIKDSIERISIATYNANDTCLLIVNRFVNIDNYYNLAVTDKQIKFVDLECYADKSPVPNFWHNNYTAENTNCHLPSDFNIYVLDAMPGIHFDEQYLKDKAYMPKKWKHGYSKGLAINEKSSSIIYWLVIW